MRAAAMLRHFILLRQYMKARILILFPFTVTAVSCTVFSPPATPLPTVSPQQHIILHNGVLLTMDESSPQAQALEIRGQMITAVGSNEEILALEQAGTRVVDLDGRTLMPGFVDAHTHLFNDAEQYFDMSLDEVQEV
jgi:hypothetical protein